MTGVFLMTSSAITLNGCTLPPVAKARAAEALENKYGEKFEITSFQDAGLLQDYYTVDAYACAYPDLPFRATVDEDSYAVSDSYVTKRLCNRISEKISQNIASLSDDYYVYTKAMLDDTLLAYPNVSLDEYLKDSPGEQFTVHLFIVQKENTLNEIATSLINLMDGIEGLNGSVCLYLSDEKLLQEVQDYTSSHIKLYQKFMDLTDSAYMGSVEVTNGSFFLSTEKLTEMAGDRV